MVFSKLAGGRVTSEVGEAGGVSSRARGPSKGSTAPDRTFRRGFDDTLDSGDDLRLPPAAILLVDDRPSNLLALEGVLSPLGQRLIKARSGEEALKYVLQEDFAVILMDVQMPGLNGIQTAELIKLRERSRHIPIIFLSAMAKEPSHIF